MIICFESYKNHHVLRIVHFPIHRIVLVFLNSIDKNIINGD